MIFYYNLIMARIRSRLIRKIKNKTSFKPEKINKKYNNEFRICITII